MQTQASSTIGGKIRIALRQLTKIKPAKEPNKYIGPVNNFAVVAAKRIVSAGEELFAAVENNLAELVADIPFLAEELARSVVVWQIARAWHNQHKNLSPDQLAASLAKVTYIPEHHRERFLVYVLTLNPQRKKIVALTEAGHRDLALEIYKATVDLRVLERGPHIFKIIDSFSDELRRDAVDQMFQEMRKI